MKHKILQNKHKEIPHKEKKEIINFEPPQKEPKENPSGKPNQNKKKIIKFGIITITSAIIISLLSLIIARKISYSITIFFSIILLFSFYYIIKQVLKKAERLKKMEDVFPDFIELMASNLRAGMTIDKALILSSRKEFSPLDEEILNLGKDILTGKEISSALLNLAQRTKSEKILKTITIINSGIRSGGNLAILLEQTAINMRERGFVEKKAASNVLMYIIFIFFAVAVGAPILFSLSTVLVQVLTSILKDIPTIEQGIATANLPLALTKINISVNFILYFTLVFLVLIDILASLLLGLVNKGEEKAGLKFTIPLIITSILIFFIVRFALTSYFSGIIG